MKTSELLKKLKKEADVKFVRHGGEYDIYYSPITGKEIPIQRHKGEVKKGTLSSILKDAGLK